MSSAPALKLAEQIRQTGRRSPQELLPLIEKAEKLAEQAPDPFTRGVYIRASGNAHQLLSNFTAALERYDSAVVLFEKANDPAQLGRTLLAKVGLLFYLSRFDELFECAGKARDLFEKEEDEAALARLRVNLGNAYQRLDRYSEALDCYEQAFPVLERLGDKEGLLASSLNAAVVLTMLHQFERADERYTQASTLARELGMDAVELQSQYNRTYLNYLKGYSGIALRSMGLLKKEFEKREDDNHVCLCWLDEAEMLLELGDLPESIQAARQARTLAEKLGLNYEIGKSLLFEAAASLRTEEDPHAEGLLSDAIGRFESEENNVWSAVSQLQAALFRGERGQIQALSEAASARKLLAERSLPDRTALADIVIGRIQRVAGDQECAIDSFQSAVQLAETSNSKWMQFHALHELGVSLSQTDDARSVTFLRKAESMLDVLWHRIGSDDLKMAFLGDRENVYTHLVANVASTSSDEAFRLSERARSWVLVERLAGVGERILADQIPTRLDDDETIVEYFIAGDDLYTFVVNRDGLECVHRAGVGAELEQECAHLERHFASCSVGWEKLGKVSQHLERTALAHLKALYDGLIGPVRGLLNKKTIIVPHGFLHGVPFHALHDGEGFLSENHSVAYSPSATLYVTPSVDEGNEPPLFVAFSPGPDEGIEEEIRQTAERFPKAMVLINPSVDELTREMNHYRPLLHVAGHAGIDPVRGSLSWLETPQGRLTSRDLMDTQFRAGTVVVTGCYTARRTISAGDEWLGLMRAFYMSGAHTIVSAYWAIRDESAQMFSKNFYENYDGMNAVEAVGAAAAAIRETSPHPYFWGGFGTFARKRKGDSL